MYVTCMICGEKKRIRTEILNRVNDYIHFMKIEGVSNQGFEPSITGVQRPPTSSMCDLTVLPLVNHRENDKLADPSPWTIILAGFWYCKYPVRDNRTCASPTQHCSNLCNMAVAANQWRRPYHYVVSLQAELIN
ncbi:hypothetical protein WA026_009499 [Henosepilachna vigintioctopunctata]|uniref:Uncharacterized protein n=1 Tax=Henosepilachna vigintioctopunctata TaxID=420089 RepID=A0AAW1U655_9CUCU